MNFFVTIDQEFNGTRRNLRKSSSDKAPLFGDLDIVSQEDIGIHLSKAMLSEYKHNLPLTTQQIIDTNSHFEYSSVYIIGIFCLVLLIVYRNVFRFRKI